MKNVTLNEYKEIVSEYWKGNVTSQELDQYEIVLEIPPTHESEFINNLVTRFCDDQRQEENRILYMGQSRFLNRNELVENGFSYVSEWSDGYREVFISEQHNAIVTTCEGDLSVSLTDSNEAYKNEIDRCTEFYNEY